LPEFCWKSHFCLHSHGISNWELWLLVVANAAIGFGLIIEFFCIHAAVRANQQLKTESDTKLGEALNRAANAEKALLDYRRPRRALIRPKIAVLAEKLKPFAGTEFDVGIGADGEQADCAWDIEEVLRASGWKQLNWGVHAVGVTVIHRNPQSPTLGSVSAVNLEIHLAVEERNRLLPAAEALVAALEAVGVAAREVPINIGNAHTQAMHILIGPKQ
jgi:hypothetical protein